MRASLRDRIRELHQEISVSDPAVRPAKTATTRGSLARRGRRPGRVGCGERTGARASAPATRENATPWRARSASDQDRRDRRRHAPPGHARRHRAGLDRPGRGPPPAPGLLARRRPGRPSPLPPPDRPPRDRQDDARDGRRQASASSPSISTSAPPTPGPKTCSSRPSSPSRARSPITPRPWSRRCSRGRSACSTRGTG